MKILPLICLLSCSIFAQTPDPERWDLVSKGKEGSIVYLEVQGKRTAAGTVLRWVQFFKPTGRTMSLYDFDCKGGRLRVVQFIRYVDGKVTGDTLDGPQAWELPAPETIGEVVYGAVCNVTAVDPYEFLSKKASAKKKAKRKRKS